MAYDKQTFTVGQVLTAAEQNQIEENIEEVRRAHKGTSAPPQLVAGVEWIDDTATPWTLKVYDGADQIPKGTIDPDLNLYRPATLGTHVDQSSGSPVISETGLNAASTLTRETWESIGPTGSGATNIWTALDGVPSDVDWLDIRANMDVSAGTGTFVSLDFHVRETGSAIAAGDENKIGRIGISSPNTGSHADRGIVNFKVPVNSLASFDAYWTSSGSTTNILMYLTGQGYNA